MMISVMIVRSLLVELQRRGLSPEQARRALGVREDDLRDARGRLPATELQRIVLRAMQASADPGLGLQLGAQAPDTMLGTLGMLVLSARTLRHAFSLLQRYVPLMAADMSWKLVEDGPHATFLSPCKSSLEAAPRFAADFTLVMMLRIARKLIPQADVQPLAVMFQHQEPDYAKRYDAVFKCPVSFGQEANALVFERSVLDIPQPFADAMLYEALLEQAERDLSLLGVAPRRLSDRVRTQLQHDIDAATVGGQTVAHSLGVTHRQLRRRLAVEGVSVTDLLSEARRDYALSELRHGTPIQQISDRLGFSERSAFHRAFKRWTGQTPMEYLARLPEDVVRS